MGLDGIYAGIAALKANMQKVVRGKGEIIDLAIATLISRGHLLIEDVPGVGKTTLAHSIARSINCSFQRIQFTSDLLPSDVIGVTVYDQSAHSFDFRPGPIFANVVLADEINRTTPKTQSALLEAMNDRQVTVDKVSHPLPEPFMLLATQNPLEYAGTFPLPESQLDRFTMCLGIGYPSEADELDILRASPDALKPDLLKPVINTDELKAMQDAAGLVRVDEDIASYILSIVTGTRTHRGLRLGVSPRGTMTIYRAAQALSLVRGRNYATPDDIKELAIPVFAHRVMPAWQGAGERLIDAKTIIEEVLSRALVPV